METIKIFVKDINLFDGNSCPNVLARYNLLLSNKTTNQQYREVSVDLMENNEEMNTYAISNPTNYDGPIDSERLKDILIESYNYHAAGGSFLDNFLFFDDITPASKINFEIDETGKPLEVHYMDIKK
jgi:hypothetical protein